MKENKLSTIKTFLIFIILSIVLSIIFLLLSFITPILNEDNALFLSEIITSLIMIIYLGKNLSLIPIKTSPNFTNLKKDFKLGELLKISFSQISFSFGSIIFLIGILFIISPTFAQELSNEPITLNSINPLFQFLQIAIVAPILEELLFRSVLFGNLSKKYSFWLSSIISSIIFAILHAQLSILGAFIFGIICCALYQKYKNILIPIIIHLINNILVSLPTLFSPSASTDEILTLSTNEAYFFIVLGLTLISITSIVIFKFIKNTLNLKVN